MLVARRYRFSASHRLHSPQLTDEKNRALYGKCNNPFGHGHDYVLEVVVQGEPDNITGLIVPVSKLDALVRTAVLADYENKFMNAEIPTYATVVPTTENVTSDIHCRLRAAWPSDFAGTSLATVRIWETKRNIVESNGTRKELAV
ncbi:MAG: 6-carboxytetrahydropterin synthase [Acidobacteria bacterium]|nr:6-carboxytetrahydropterin synthase [Acidobacteriota bacterium]